MAFNHEFTLFFRDNDMCIKKDENYFHLFHEQIAFLQDIILVVIYYIEYER